MNSTTTRAQRINKRQNAIWDRAKSLAADKSAPLGRCPKCKQPLRYYDGCLGYEAARCDACNFERDLHAEENGNPVEGEFAADKTAHTPGPWKATTHRYPDGLYNGRTYITTEIRRARSANAGR